MLTSPWQRLSRQLLILRFTARTVLCSRGGTVFGPLGDAFKCVHHSTHEDGTEKVLKRTEDVGAEREHEQANDDEEGENGEIYKLERKVNEAFVEQDERNSSHNTSLCQPTHNNYYYDYQYFLLLLLLQLLHKLVQ